MDDILQIVAAGSDQPAALASLVWNSGSIPMSQRAKMLVYTDGRMLGTIGGGCLEAEILAVGRQVIEAQEPAQTRYTMTEKRAGESGLNCGGTVRIFTEPVQDAWRWIYARVDAARQQRQTCAMATVIGPAAAGDKAYLDTKGHQGQLAAAGIVDHVATQLEEILAAGKGRIIKAALTAAQARALGVEVGAELEIFVEPFLPTPHLVVFGGGHVGGQICQAAAGVGFRVSVVDDRAFFATPERHPRAARCLAATPQEAFEQLAVDEHTYIVAATRGHQHDEEVIEGAIKTPARYIGMLGSERKKMVLWKRIGQRGGDAARLGQVHAPVGLNIGADTPEEIAISVVAELIAVLRAPTKVWKTKKALVLAP